MANNNFDLVKAFLGEGVEETTQPTNETVEMTVKSIKPAKNFQVKTDDGNVLYTIENALVYTFEGEDGKKVQKADSVTKSDGTPKKSFFTPMNWYDNRVIRASVSYDVKESVKNKLGEEKYEKLKEKHGDKISSKMLIGQKVDMVLPYYQLPLEAKYGLWNSLVKNNVVADWDEIDEVRDMFNLAENKQEDQLEERDDLPF